jgi:toxin ParE1/3/4
MGYLVRIMPQAEADLVGIFQGINAARSESAFRWFMGLEHAINALENSPRRCPVAPEDRNLRHLLYGKKPHIYRVIFRIVEARKEVDILHIRHGARDKFDVGELPGD